MDVGKEYVIMGNDVLLACQTPSHVADQLYVTSWADSEGHEFAVSDRMGKIVLRFAASPFSLCNLFGQNVIYRR